MLITNSAIVENIGVFSGTGGITNFGVLRVTNTTIAGNTVVNGFGSGSGALSVYDGDVLLTNCTIVDNTSPDGGGPGGMIRTAGVLALHNTILARNTGRNGGDCLGSITSQGHNLIRDPTGCAITLLPTDLIGDPGLGDFADNGTPGNGHYPLLPSSQAIDAGDKTACPKRDQLGERRVGPCDIGAIEFQDQDDDQDDRRHGEDSVATAQEPQ